MCIMFTDSSPSNTLLVLAPLDAADWWQLLYVNSISAPGALMIVPVPNAGNLKEDEFVLSEVTSQDTDDIREALRHIFPPELDPDMVDLFSDAAAESMPQSLFVQSIGNFQVSVAPSLHELRTRAPWQEFHVPAQRVATILAGLHEAFGGAGWAFVVAKASLAVKGSGFAITFKSAWPYAPTMHESAGTASGGSSRPMWTGQAWTDHVGELVQMDATVVAIDAQLEPDCVMKLDYFGSGRGHALRPHAKSDIKWLYQATGSSMPPSRDGAEASRWAACRWLLETLPKQGAGVLHHGKSLRHARDLSCVCQWRLEGTCTNTNVVGRDVRFGRQAPTRSVQAVDPEKKPRRDHHHGPETRQTQSSETEFIAFLDAHRVLQQLGQPLWRQVLRS